tara:strand:+ start:288 stop:461 length:174 start_codon:yes stop_codon:yes gene_type:complete
MKLSVTAIEAVVESLLVFGWLGLRAVTAFSCSSASSTTSASSIAFTVTIPALLALAI